MVHEDIFGGLKSALVRGYTLKEAMISFYNAGYSREDIEDAARQLQYHIAENKELKDLIGQKNLETTQKNTYVSPGSKNIPQAKSISRVEVSSASAPASAVAPQVTKTVASPPASSTTSATEQKEHGKKASSGIDLHNVFKRNPKVKAKPREKQRQQVSPYEAATGIRVVTIVLVVLLLMLMAMLGAVFIFKNQIIQFFNGLLK